MLTDQRHAAVAPDRRTGERLARVPVELALFGWGLPVLWLVSLAATAYLRVFARATHLWGLPNRYDDFICYWRRVPLVHTIRFFTAPDVPAFGSGWGYPAPPIWIYRLFYLFDPVSAKQPFHGYWVMVTATVCAIGAIGWRLSQEMRRRGLSRWAARGLVASAAFLNWPLFLAVQRGNIEMVLWLPVAAGVWAFARKRWMLAALLLGAGAAFKLYPILLLALFLRERRFGAIAVGLGTAALITIVSLWYIGPTLPLAVRWLGLGVSGFLREHGATMNWPVEGLNHSLFHLLKVHVAESHGALPIVLRWYMAGVAALMGAVFFSRTIHLPWLNQLTVLVVSMVALPATSYDYTLLALLIPWAGLALVDLAAAGRGRYLPGLTSMMALYLLLLGPETFLVSHHYLHSGALKAVCLALLLVLANVYPLAGEQALPIAAKRGRPGLDEADPETVGRARPFQQ